MVCKKIIKSPPYNQQNVTWPKPLQTALFDWTTPLTLIFYPWIFPRQDKWHYVCIILMEEESFFDDFELLFIKVIIETLPALWIHDSN